MIFDNLNNAEIYISLHNGIRKGLEYIKNNDVASMEPQTIILEDTGIKILIQEYIPKDINDTKLEGHIDFIDIQYIISGTETIGYLEVSKATETSPYDPEKDVAFFDGRCTYIDIEKNEFFIFYPNDLHRPGIKPENYTQGQKVKKAVVKIPVKL